MELSAEDATLARSAFSLLLPEENFAFFSPIIPTPRSPLLPSPVMRYRVAMSEIKEDCVPGSRRTAMAFQLLNELLPHTGVFREILTEIKSDLFGKSKPGSRLTERFLAAKAAL